MKLPIADLRQKVIATLSQNLNPEEAAVVADCLLWAEMSGISDMGVSKLTGTEPLQNAKPTGAVTVERDTKLSQLINANSYPSPLVTVRAADVAIAKAKEHGFAIVGVHNTFTSNGALAYYAERIAGADLISIILARSPGTTAPFNSLDPLFGTNPMAFGFPTNGDPLVFDMATSAMTWYSLVLAKSKNEQIPEGVAIDSDGNLTTDPAKAMKGALLPFDHGHKGSGLGMVVEILAGPLAASAYCDCETFDQEWGTTVIAIDPNLLVDTAKFKADCSDLIAKMRAARPAIPGQPIRLPGDHARAVYQEAVKSGLVSVDENVLKTLDYT